MMNLSPTDKKIDKIYKTDTIFKEKILEEDKLIKYLLNYTILFGALGFLVVGISSYISYNIVPFLKADDIIFFPQGLTMCFYGTCGTLVGLNQLQILTTSIGEGYNEFNKEKGVMNIYRKGKDVNSDINITYPLTDIEAIKVEIKTELFNTKQNIYVCVKGKKDLPIIQIEKPLKISEVEEKASQIASFLQVPVKGL